MRKQAAEDAAAAAAAARAAEAAGKRPLEQAAAGRDITGVAGRKVQGRFGLEWEYMVRIGDCTRSVPLLDGESIGELERNGELVIGIIHHIWVQKKYAERTDNAWVQVRLGTGSHESDVSHTRSVTTPATVPGSKADCERDAQCVTGALALLHKPVVLPSDVDFLSVPTLLRHEPFKFVKSGKWGFPDLQTLERFTVIPSNYFAPTQSQTKSTFFAATMNRRIRRFIALLSRTARSRILSLGEWYDLLSDGFAQVGVTKILEGYRAVPKKRNPPKPAPVTAKPASLGDLASDLGALSVA